MYEIVIGRNKKDRDEFGTEGTILLGKHYVKMGQTTSLSNPVLMDVVRSHIVFVTGKRGGGKSYSMGVIAEGMSSLPKEISQNLSIIMLDTMGIYWTMKYPNKKEENLLVQWNIKPRALDVKIFTPKGFFDEYRKRGIPTDTPFALKPSELDPSDWHITFGVTQNDPVGVLIERVVIKLREEGKEYSIDDIIGEIRKDEKSAQNAKDAAENRFMNAKTGDCLILKAQNLKSLSREARSLFFTLASMQ